MYIFAIISKCVSPCNREEMRDAYINLINVYDKSAPCTKLTQEIIINFLEDFFASDKCVP